MVQHANALDIPMLKEIHDSQETNPRTWAKHGKMLGTMSRQLENFSAALNFCIGDWFNRGERFDREAIINDPRWTGPSLKTCRNLGTASAKIDVSRRRETLPFTHQMEVAALPPEEADRILDEVEEKARETGEMPPSRQVRQIAKQKKREHREVAMAESTMRESKKLKTDVYGVIYADPPWPFEVYSRETGMDRHAENHYGTMSLEEIRELEIPAARDCVLFLWATAPQLENAIDVMRRWGFEYRSHVVWVKDRAGTGHWFRSQHEILLVGGKGHPVAPAEGTQYESVIYGKRTKHSEKPNVVYEMIEAYYPEVPKIEMFARKFRSGWAAFGNELPELEEAAA